MLPLKYQFEIRYTNILNFNDIYREIASPYLKVADFVINRNLDGSEYIVLHFKDEKVMIDVRWDRIIFTVEGKREDMDASAGPLYYYFEILDKIAESPAFGKFKNAVLGRWQLLELESDVEVVKAFSKKFLTDKNIFVGEEGYDLADIMVTLNFGDPQTKSMKINYGPFKPEVDIVGQNLLLFTPTKDEELNAKNRILIYAIAFEETNEGNLATFKTLNKKLNSALKNFKYE